MSSSSGVFGRQESIPRQTTTDLDDLFIEPSSAVRPTYNIHASNAAAIELEEGFTQSARYLKTQTYQKPSLYERMKRYFRIKLYAQESLADFHRTSDVYIQQNRLFKWY